MASQNAWRRTQTIVGTIVAILVLSGMVTGGIMYVGEYKSKIDSNTVEVDSLKKKFTKHELQQIKDMAEIKIYLRALVKERGIVVTLPDSLKKNTKGFIIRGRNEE